MILPYLTSRFLDIYKKAELTDNNIFRWVSQSLFNDSGYCYKLSKMTYENIFKMMITFQSTFKTINFRCMLKKRSQEITLDEN